NHSRFVHVLPFHCSPLCLTRAPNFATVRSLIFSNELRRMKHSRIVLLLACASLAGEFLCHTLGYHTPIQAVEHIFPRPHAPAIIAVAAVKPVRKPPMKLHPDQARALITHAAKEHRVPVALVKSIMAAESNFDCNALSDKGAVGLMQLMPATAAEYGA